MWNDPKLTNCAVPSKPQNVSAVGTANTSQLSHQECGGTADQPNAEANELSAPAVHTQLTIANGLTARFTPPGLRSMISRYSGLSTVAKIVRAATTTAAIATIAPANAISTA